MTVVLAGRYELDRRLGRGGMAEVWRGRDLVLGRRIAVKTVDVTDATDLSLGDRLRREAVSTAALDHPDIVTIHDAGVDGDTAFLVMELVAGRNLAAVLADGPLPLPEAVRIAGRVAGALAAAHAAGIVHRDIKPANIIVNGDKVTVVDFGIAAIEFQATTSLTAPGTTLGTAEYMAPEQARAEPATSGTDMYAFGCLLTALVSGRPPFTAEVPVAILHHHAFIQAPRLRSLRPDVPEELDALVGALLDKDVTARPSATEAHERLARIALALAGATPGATPPAGPAGGAELDSPATSANPVSSPPTAEAGLVGGATSATPVSSPPTAEAGLVGGTTSATPGAGAPTAHAVALGDATAVTTSLDPVATAPFSGVHEEPPAAPTAAVGAAAAGAAAGPAAGATRREARAAARNADGPARRAPRRGRLIIFGTAALVAGAVAVSASTLASGTPESVGKVVTAAEKVRVAEVAAAQPTDAPAATAVPSPAATAPVVQPTEPSAAPAPEVAPAATGKGQHQNQSGPENNNGRTGKGQSGNGNGGGNGKGR